jgi:hypothetical protein
MTLPSLWPATVPPVTDTSLSDVMDAPVQANTAETYAAFVEMFRNSVIGIIGVGLPEPDGLDRRRLLGQPDHPRRRSAAHPHLRGPGGGVAV